MSDPLTKDLKRFQRGHVGPDEHWDQLDTIIAVVLLVIAAGVALWLI
jgi:hypothetical protein